MFVVRAHSHSVSPTLSSGRSQFFSSSFYHFGASDAPKVNKDKSTDKITNKIKTTLKNGGKTTLLKNGIKHFCIHKNCGVPPPIMYSLGGKKINRGIYTYLAPPTSACKLFKMEHLISQLICSVNYIHCWLSCPESYCSVCWLDTNLS